MEIYIKVHLILTFVEELSLSAQENLITFDFVELLTCDDTRVRFNIKIIPNITNH